MAKKTIRQRIALDGGAQIKKELEEFGAVGEKAFRDLQAAANRLDGVGSGFVKSLQNAQKSMAAVSKSFVQVGKELRNVGQTISTYVTLPIVGLGATALKVAGDFESAMNEFVANTGAAGNAFDLAREKAIDLGNASIFSATESANAMTELAKVGLDFEQIMEGAAEATVKLAAANGAQLAPAAAVVGDIMNQFALTARDVPGIINGVSGALIQSKLDFDGYRIAIGQAGGTAGALGVTLEDFNAVLAATASSFASGSDAGTSFKTFLQRLTPNTKKAAELFKQLNLQFFDSQGNMRSMAEIAQELQDKFGAMSEEALNINLGELFGTDAIRTAIALMKQGGEGIDEMRRKLANTNAEELAAVRVRGLVGALDQLRSAFDDAAIAVGDTGLLKLFTDLTLKSGELLRSLADASPKTLSFGIAIAGVAAAIGPLLTSIGLMTIGIGGLVSAGAKVVGMTRTVIAAFVVLRGVMLTFPGLVAFQLIGGAIALWAASANEASAALERHRGVVDTIRESYAKVGAEIEKMTQATKDRLALEAGAQLKDEQEALTEATKSLQQELFIAREQQDFGPLIQQFLDAKISAEELADAVAAIGANNPDLAPAAQELLEAIKASGVEELARAVTETQAHIDLLTGKITDAEFKATDFGQAFKSSDAESALANIGNAVDETKGKVEALNETIRVTRFGGAGEPVKDVFNVVDGVAQAVEKTQEELDKLDKSAKAAGEKIKQVADQVQTVVRTAPQALDAPTVQATADAVVSGLQKIPPVARTVATEANTAISEIGKVDNVAGAEESARAIVTPFRTAADQIKAIASEIQVAVRSVPEALNASAVDAAANAIVVSLQKIPPAARTAAADANAALDSIGNVGGAETAAQAILAPFQRLADQIRAIFAGIESLVRDGFTNIGQIVNSLAGQIQAAINRILAALRAAAAAAAKLKAQASSSSSSSSSTSTFATGGFVRGPGTGTSDSIPAWLSSGEFVVNARATRMFLPLLRAINGFALPADFLRSIRGFSLGGLVEGFGRSMTAVGSAPLAMAAGGLVPAPASPGRPISITLDGETFDMVAEDSVAEKLQRFATGKALRSAGRKPGWYR